MGIATRLTNIGDLLVNAGQSGGFDEFTGAPVVDSSLVLWLDAGQTASYPGTGTTWTDLSGNGNTGTLVNGPTYNSENGGSIVLDGVDDFINVSNPASLNPGSNSFTIDAWVYQKDNGFNGVVDARGANLHGFLCILNYTSAGFISFFLNTTNDVDQNVYVSTVATFTDVLAWMHVSVVVNRSANNITFYKNGIQQGASVAITSGGSVNPSSGYIYYVGADLGGPEANINLSTIKQYNRALSAQEVQKNYNALAPRHGLPRISGAGTIRTTPTVVYASELDEFTGVSIVDSSLLLWLDTGQETSYPGTGTTWTNLGSSGNAGTLVNGPAYNNDNGGSLVFDGVDDSVDIGSGYTQQIFSVEFVVKPGSSQLTYADIIDNNHTGTRSWVIQQNATTLNQYYFYTMADAPVFTLTTNQWSHVICTFNSQTNSKNIYVNGVLVNTGAAPVITYDGTEFLRLGRWGGSGRHWNGQNSLTRFYNRALSAAEVQQNYNALAPRYELPPVNTVSIAKRETSRGVLQVAGKFDEFTGAPVVDSSLKMWLDIGQPTSYPNTGTTWTDLSGNGNTGTLVNGPTYSSANGGNLVFDGTNDYIQTPITGTYTQISFDFWGFFDDPTFNMLSREESAFGDWTSNRVHFGTRWTGSSAGMHFNVNGIWQTTPATNLRYGWNHYLLIYDTIANQKLVYLNGILSSSNVTNGSMVLGDFKIGVATNLGAYYRGNISNFKIYNRAVTADEISTNFNALRGRYGI